MIPVEILFKEDLGKGGKPIFDSQTELVKEITSKEGSEWKGKKFESVRAFVNQVINGERRLSPNLKNAISLVIPERIGEKRTLEETMTLIEQSFNDYYEEKRGLKKSRTFSNNTLDANDFYLLEKRGLLADTIFITTREPGIVNNQKWSNEIKLQLLGKLGLIEIDNVKIGKYKLFFPASKGLDNKVFKFWQELYTFMKYETKIPDTEQKLLDINSGENAKLKVFHAPPLLCSYPIIIYDLNTFPEVAFTVFGYIDKGVEKISTARIAPEFLKWWKEGILPGLSLKNNSEDILEIKFEKVLDDIKKNESLF